MRVVFWVSVAFVFYAYAGYPMLLWVLARFSSRPIAKALYMPPVSIVMAVHNEATGIAPKLMNIQRLEYPRDRFEVLVVNDGSTDRTAHVVDSQLTQGLRVLHLPERSGKAVALNQAVAAAKHEIVVFMDCRQRIKPNALQELCSNFADPSVGAVSGELMITSPGNSTLGLYWTIEKMVRRLESQVGSVIGATGALYAIRKELYHPIPTGTILDDVYVPVNIMREGKRVIFEPCALAFDQVLPEREFRRKVRTLYGNYQLLRLCPWLLDPRKLSSFQFISHKVLRLLVPFALVLSFVSAAMAQGKVYRLAWVAQVLFYLLAFGTQVDSQWIRKLGRIPRTILELNAAALVAFVHAVRGRKNVWG